MIVYRLGNYLYKCRIPLLPRICDVLIRLFYRSAVFTSTEIGRGTIFAYGGIAIVIHRRARIGNNCIIGSCVTIGGKSKSVGVPVIGDGVYIATGAKILGDIQIGDGCVIGANAVVTKSIPPHSLVVGIPAKVIKSDIQASDYY